MKADELMVGDIVLRKGKPVEIVSTSGIEYSFGQQDITEGGAGQGGNQGGGTTGGELEG